MPARILLALACSTLVLCAGTTVAGTIVVTNLNDSGPGSLRAAIEAASPPTTITFHASLAGGTIVLQSPLPQLPMNTTIDGDLGGDCDPDIALDGSAVTEHGLRIHTSGCTVRGLAIGGFAQDGISVGVLSGSDIPAVIECSHLGVRLDGSTPHGNGQSGVSIGQRAGGTRLGPGNVIANNAGSGVFISESFDDEAYPEFEGLTPDATERFPVIDFPHTCAAFASADGMTPLDGGGHTFTNSFGMRLTGTVTVEEAGDYTFDINRLQDEVRLVVDGGTVLDLEYETGSAVLALGAGDHDIQLDFFEGNWEAELRLEITGPGKVALSSGGQPGLEGELFQLRLPVEGVTITENSIYDNGGRGIELECGCGPTDDPGDPDLGPNTCLNAPLFTADTALGGRDFTVAGTAAPGSTVEVFASAGDRSGAGEGRTLLDTVTADSNGDFDATVTLPAGFYGVTATATDGDGNTSEFSRNHGLVTHYLTVTSSDDSGPGTLRDALDQSIADGTDTVITFDLALAGATIGLESPLPAVSDDGTIVDGDIDADCWPDIELDGSLVDDSGLRVESSDNIVRGLVINRFANDGILIRANQGGSCTGNTVACCFLGTDASGLTALPNGRTNPYSAGVRIDSSANNLIGGHRATARNLLSGNLNGGVHLYGPGATGNVIAGNLVGTDVTGTQTLGNSYSGISLQGADGNIVGGDRSTHGNLVSGNVVGITVYASSNTVAGNLVGTDITGTTAVPNTADGMVISGGGDDNLIGGLAATAGNLVSGNAMRGILIISGGTDGNRVEGNFIGTDVTGTQAMGNASEGVAVYGGVGNIIGSTDPARRNVICSNGWSGVNVWFDFTVGTQIIGNWIGIGADGVTQLGNGKGVGLWLQSSGSVVGGPGGAANRIAYNDSEGVSVFFQGAQGETFGYGNRISRNSIHDNGGLGIDLGNEGIDANDPGDGDDGPNRLVNSPLLTSAVTVCGGGATTVTGAIDTGDPDLGVVELFGSPAGDPSGFGEGQIFLAQTVAAFNGAFTYVVPAQPTGSVITTTYTDADGNTSEYSNAALVQTTPLSPSGLHALIVAGPAVDLAWHDNATDETGFRIERRTAGDPDFAFLANVAANVTNYHDTAALATGTAYSYRVRAEGACLTAWSNVALALVPGEPASFCPKAVSHHRNAQQPVLEYGNGFFGAAWRECEGLRCAIAYARLDLTGAIVAGPTIVTPWADQSAGPQLSWNGSEWGMLWFERLGGAWGLLFERLDASGAVIDGPQRLDAEAALVLPNNSRNRGLAWDGAGWGVVWRGDLAGASHVYYAHLDADGAIDVAATMIDDGGAAVAEPMVAFDGAHFGVVWLDSRGATPQFYLRRIAPDGTPLGASVPVTNFAAFRSHADFAWSGAEYGLTWNDQRDGDIALYFTRFSPAGAVLSGETRLNDARIPGTLDIGASDPFLRFLGDRWVVASEDWRSTSAGGGIQLSYADLAGAKLGADFVVSETTSNDYPALAWGADTLLAAWFTVGDEWTEIYVQAMDRFGDRGDHPLRQITSGHEPGGRAQNTPAIVPLGSGLHAVAWNDTRSPLGGQIFMRIVDPSGAPVGDEIEVADAVNDSAYNLIGPPVAFSGEVLGVLFRDGSNQLHFRRLDEAGNRIGTDAVLGTSDSSEALVWTGEAFIAAWSQWVNDNREIVTAAIAADGTVLALLNRISNAAGISRGPSLAGDGAALAVAWYDNRDGNYEIYAAALDPLGRRTGAETRVTAQAALQAWPALAWNGSEYLLAWRDARNTVIGNQIWAKRLAADATPLGSEMLLSDGRGDLPRVAWNGSSWGVVFVGTGGLWFCDVAADGSESAADRLVLPNASRAEIVRDGGSFLIGGTIIHYSDGEIVVGTLGCALDDTPPMCPDGLKLELAWRSAILSWQPGDDGDGGVLWQAVYRDGVRVAVLEPEVGLFADLVAPLDEHVYRVTTLNHALLESPGCPEAVLDDSVWDAPLFADDFETGTTAAWSDTVP